METWQHAGEQVAAGRPGQRAFAASCRRGRLAGPSEGPVPLLVFPVPGTGWSTPGHRTRSWWRAGKTRDRRPFSKRS